MRFAFRLNALKTLAHSLPGAASGLIRPLLYAFLIAANLGSLALFSRLLRAEGPLLQVYVWNALSTAAILIAFGKPGAGGRPAKGRKRLGAAMRKLPAAAALVLAGAGTILVLLQLQIARRSLAEAWLDLARKGSAFGFFSFFVSELYALFLLGPVMLAARKRYAAAACAFAAIQLLCAGIILDSSLCLVSAIAAVLLLYAFLPGGSPVGRLKSAAVPTTAALALSLIVLVWPRDSAAEPFYMPYPDLAPLAAKLAPSFPLLRDVPGYGFTPGAATMPASVYFSVRQLFSAYGTPLSVHYLAETRYLDWTGSGWTEDPDKGPEVTILRQETGNAAAPGIEALFSRGAPKKTVTLVLTEDFSTAIPVSSDTAAVVLSSDAPADAHASRFAGVRFSTGAQRGLRAELYAAPDGVEAEAEERAEVEFLSAGRTRTPPALAELARTLRLQARTDREFISLILDRFAEGYVYSLETEKVPAGKDAIESFVFVGKKGFCLYFAGAFVLLAREGGLEARLVEGYRVQLDEKGIGSISGNNAHAWPEVYLDGAWRLFEPTPPYAMENPFAYVDAQDRNAKKQIEALFGRDTNDSGSAQTHVSGRIPAAAIGSAVLALASLALASAAAVRAFEPPSRKTIRRARKLAAKFRKQGIAGPEISGWKKWGTEVDARAADQKAAELANAMLSLAFSRKDRPV